MKRKFIRIYALLLCMILVVPCMLPAKAATYAAGSWEETYAGGHKVWAWVLDNPVSKCSSFTVEFDVELDYGARVKTWYVWARNGSTFNKVGSVYLSDGCGSVTSTINVKPAQYIDAIALTPSVNGSYTYSFSLGVYDFNGATTSSATKPSESSTRPASALNGYYRTMKISSCTIDAFMFNSTLKRVKEITVSIDVEMYNNCTCKNWQVWRVNGDDNYTKIGTIYLPKGNGSGSTTIKFKNGQTIEGIAVTPIASGGFSWDQELTVYDVKYF